MEAARTSETSVDNYFTWQQSNVSVTEENDGGNSAHALTNVVHQQATAGSNDEIVTSRRPHRHHVRNTLTISWP